VSALWFIQLQPLNHCPTHSTLGLFFIVLCVASGKRIKSFTKIFFVIGKKVSQDGIFAGKVIKINN
jgi:hypothetical protein